MYNLLIGGAAGDGIETMAGVFEKILKEKGFFLFSMRDFMSRVRGGHNFALIRFGARPVAAHRDALDGLVVFNEESYALHREQLKPEGFVLCDSGINIEGDHVIRLDLRGMARASGNPKTIGTVCIGALLKLFGLGVDGADKTLEKTLAEKIAQANLLALKLGYDAASERYTVGKPDGKPAMLLTGAEAMSLGALAGGLRFYSAYPMSPSTTLLEYFTRHGAALHVAVEQAEDEIAAVNMALGASYAGARAMAGTSGGGFSLMVEALGFAGGAEIPVVLADIQRPGPSTGLPTRTEQSDLAFVISASQGEFPRMVIAVRDVADAFYQTARAFYLAEKYQMPVILLSEQYIADSAMTVEPLALEKALPYAERLLEREIDANVEYLRYRVTQSGVSPLRRPGQSDSPVRIDSDEHDERGVITERADVRRAQTDKRLRKLNLLKKELQQPVQIGEEEPEILLVGFGGVKNALAEATAYLNGQHGKKVGALCFGDVYPLPAEALIKAAEKASIIINVEQNATGQLARLIRAETGIVCGASVLKYDGRQMSVDDILARLDEILKEVG